MIFDRLWRVERRSKKEKKRLKEKYRRLIDVSKDQKERDRLTNQLWADLDLIEGAEYIRTEHLIKRARKLGVAVPKPPDFHSEDPFDDGVWYINTATWNYHLVNEAEWELTRQVQKAEQDLIQYRMRWVTQVAVPLTGLIGSLMGLISLLHSLGLLGTLGLS